jgi:phage shock protein C
MVYVVVMSFMPLDDSRPAGPGFKDLFRGSSEPQRPDRKVIHDVTEQDVKDSHKGEN